MPFQKENPFRFTRENPRPGPGCPEKPQTVFARLMKASKLRHFTDEEMDMVMKSAAQVACSDFDFFKYLIERQDKAADLIRKGTLFKIVDL